jgi:hypothetical protein
MQNTFEQWRTWSPLAWLWYATIGSPSAPIETAVPNRLFVGSSVAIVADEHPTFEQCANLIGPRAVCGDSYVMTPSPSEPIAIEVNPPMLPVSIVVLVAVEHPAFSQ